MTANDNTEGAGTHRYGTAVMRVGVAIWTLSAVSIRTNGVWYSRWD